MPAHDRIITQAQLLQDLELQAAIRDLKANPTQLNTFLKKQQDNVYKNIVKQKDDTFQKVYGDLDRSQKVQESLLRYDTRNRQLLKLHKNIYNNQKAEADAIIENKNTFGRKYEMNEWSVNNKKDTLFVFSAGFVLLSALIGLTVLFRMSLISSILWGWMGAIAIIVFILILINRAQYTEMARNKHYWNKRVFPKNKGNVSICPPTGTGAGVTTSVKSAPAKPTKSFSQMEDDWEDSVVASFYPK
jgi:hypothetical protein